jgi:serine/threonine protein kinase
MAEVFEADMIGPAGFVKPVCLKRVRPELASNPDFVEMFQNEARIAAMLHHANIVTVFDFDIHNDELFLVMELIEGMDLRAILQKAHEQGHLLPPEMAVYIADCLLSALEHAHNRKVGEDPRPVIHRDVSPHNVLVSREGVVKLADFGIAKSMGLSNATRAGIIKGKLAYLSPEQLTGGTVTPVSDLFSVGLVLAEILTGERRFKADNDNALIDHVRSFRFTPIASVPDPLNHLLGGLLAVDPRDRYPAARSARAALRRMDIVPVGESEAAELVDKYMPRNIPKAAATQQLQPTAVASSRDAKTAWVPSVPEPPSTRSVPTERGSMSRRLGLYAAGTGLAIAIFGTAVYYGKSRNETTGASVEPFVISKKQQQQQQETSSKAAVVSEAGRETKPKQLRTDQNSSVTPDSSVTPEPSVTIPVASEKTSIRSVHKKRQPSSPVKLLLPAKSAAPQTAASEETDESAEISSKPVVPPKPGFVNINVRPWATVVVDGRSRGTTPIKGLSLKPGTHRIVLENSPLGYREAFRIKVSAEKTTSITKTIVQDK